MTYQKEIAEQISDLIEKKGLLELSYKASQAFIQATKVYLVISDANGGRFIWINPTLKEKLGFGFKELTENKAIDFIHPDDVQATINAQNKLYGKTISPVDGFTNRYITKRKKIIYIEWVENIRLNGTWFSIAIDSTEDKYVEQKKLYPELWQD